MTSAVNIILAPTKSGKPGWLSRLVVRFRAHICRHEFRLADLTETGIAQPEKPAGSARYSEWLDYYARLSSHPANSERVTWACCKCGKEYRAHCGLDVLSRSRGTVTHNQ
jgi:hypothetical protein